MDGNHPVTDRFRDNGLRLGQRYGHNWRQGSRQDTYPFTPSQHHIHPSPSHFRTEGIQPQSLAAITLPPFNTIMSTDPLSTPFSPSPHRPRVSYLQPVRPHNREQQYVAEPFFCDHHRASSTLQLPSPRISSSRGPTTPVSRPSSRLSWDTEDASVSTHLPWQSQFQESFIDLTADSSSPLAMPPESRKRAASGSRLSDHGSASSSKRAKLEARQTEGELENIAELDLKEVNDDETFARIFEEQRVAEVKAQHEQAEKPVSFSSLQCIICMEPMTNITVTHCGMPINWLNIEPIKLTLTSYRASVLSCMLDGSPYSGRATKSRPGKRSLQMSGLSKEGSEA